MLILVQGPAGGGKSQLVASLKEAGEVDVIADVTELWAATGSYSRGPDGKYPVRADDDPALKTAQYLKTVTVTFGLAQGYNVAVTTSIRNDIERWADTARINNTPLSVRTVDPGRDVVARNLADPETGILSEECQRAINRWYTDEN